MSAVAKTSTIDFVAVRAALRPRVEFIGARKMYSKPFLVGSDELEDAYPAFTLWKAWVDEKQPPIVIYDDSGTFRPGKLSYSLARLDVDLEELYGFLPKKVKAELQEIQDLYGAVPDDSQAWNIVYHETPALRAKGAVRKAVPDWRTFVSEVVDFRGSGDLADGDAKGTAVDPRLKLIRLCHLPKGRDQAVNGHAVVCMPGNTAKSTFYELTGPKDEKTTANSTIGYADTDGVHPGSVDGAEHTFTVDQFESQGAWQVFRYLQSLMESGKARVDTAAQPFVVRSSAVFVILANPGRSDPSKSFMFLLEHMVKEPSFGRRFAIILYDTKGQEVRGKLTREDEERWRVLIDFYRAVEAAAARELDAIYADPEVWTWLNGKPYQWVGHMLELIAPLSDEDEEGLRGLHGFLRQFLENGTPHTRGAALAAAVASNLDRILLGEIPTGELLTQAEDYFAELLGINESSVRTIAQNFREERVSMMKAWFDSRPTYLKEVIRAVLVYMKKLADAGGEPGRKVSLSDVASLSADGGYFSRVVDQAKRSNPERHNSDLKQRLGFELIRERDDLVVAVEKFDVFQIFQIFQIVGEPVRTQNERIDGPPRDPGEVPPKAREPSPAGERATQGLKEEAGMAELAPKARLVPKTCIDCGEEIPFDGQFALKGVGDLCRAHFEKRTASRRKKLEDAREEREAERD